LEVFSGNFLNAIRQICKETPKTTACTMHSQVLEIPPGLLFAGLTDQEIELSSF
jgi:hypothetical protein